MEIDLFHLAAVITIFALVYRHLTKNNDYFHDKPIPSLAVKPGIGSTGSLMFKRCSFSDYIKSIYDKFPSVKVLGLFDTTMPFFVIRDPELIKQIAVKDFDHFVDHRTIMGNDDSGDSPRLFGNSLFSMNGQRWRDMRATLSPAFTGSKMRQMFQLMVDCCETMPIPFELFPEFCQSWIENYYDDKEAVLSQLSDFKAQTNHLVEDPVKDESKISETKIRKQTKPHPEKVKLSGAMRLYGRISEDCIKLDRGLKMAKRKMELLEPDVMELEGLGEVLSKNAAKFVRPSAKKMAQKVTELEQMEKELLNVVLEVTEDEVK